MIIPSILACFLSTPYWEVSFVAAFDYKPYISAAKTFRIMFGDSWQYLWPVILVAAAQIFCAALIMSTMDRHFRTGKLSLSHPWRMINNSIFPLVVSIIILSVLSILWRFLLFGLVMLIQAVSRAAGLPTGAALAIISAVAVGLFILHVMVITPMLFWAPIMFIYGYRFRDAAALSFKMVSGRKIFRSLFLPMLLCAGIQLLVGFLQAHYAIVVVVNFLVFLFTNTYTTVFIMLSFYDISGLERRDIKPHQAVPLPVPAKKAEPQKQEKSVVHAVQSENKNDIANDSNVKEQKKANQKNNKPKKSAASASEKSSAGKTSGAGKNTGKSNSAKSDGTTEADTYQTPSAVTGEEDANGI